MHKYNDEKQTEFKKGRAYVTGTNEATIRIVLPNGEETALCTLTYCYGMTESLKNALANHIARLWNREN